MNNAVKHSNKVILDNDDDPGHSTLTEAFLASHSCTATILFSMLCTVFLLAVNYLTLTQIFPRHIY